MRLMRIPSLVALWLLVATLSPPAAFTAEIEVYFSPRGGACQAIVKRLDASTNSIDVVAYQLTYRPYLESLYAAARRGVIVRVVVDRTQTGPSHRELNALRGPNSFIVVDRREKLQHNKYTIIDGRFVVTGSMNLSGNGENHNAENTLIIDDPGLAESFRKDFDFHFAHSDRWLLVSNNRFQRPVDAFQLFSPFFSSPLEGFVLWLP